MRFLGKAGAVTMALVMVMMTQSLPSLGRTTSLAGKGPTEKCLDYGSGPRRSVLRGNVNNNGMKFSLRPENASGSAGYSS